MLGDGVGEGLVALLFFMQWLVSVMVCLLFLLVLLVGYDL